MRLIDADELENDIIGLYNKKRWYPKEVHFSLLDMLHNIDQVPTVDAIMVAKLKEEDEADEDAPTVEKHGHWKIDWGACEPDYMECSACGWITEFYGGLEEEWSYCPHCGTKMDEVEDEVS